MRRAAAVLAAGILAAAGGVALAGPADLWLHIRVEERAGKAETVRVNVPLTLLESVAPVLEDMDVDMDHLRINDKDLDAAQMRRILEAVRKSSDAELVTIESMEDHLVVSKSGDLLLVTVRDDGDERAEIRIPIAVVDALLSAPDGRLNFVAAVKALGERGQGELVAVSDATSRVRIWIDGTSASR